MKHLKEHNLSYYRHLKFALFIGFSLVWSGLLCIIHGIIPCVFETRGSDTIKKLKSRQK